MTMDVEIFRCPHCAQTGQGALEAVSENWLSCADCGRKYPIVKGIPVLLPEEGDKWRSTAPAETTRRRVSRSFRERVALVSHAA